jgi:predicted  nucleic acid-binding Zn-ribbon protein
LEPALSGGTGAGSDQNVLLKRVMNAKQLIQRLSELQALEFSETELDEVGEKKIEKTIAELRLQIPLPILNHYDRLAVRGKKGVAAVRHQTCTGCHMQVTRAIEINLMHGDDIQVCDNCGRYLYLAPSVESESPTGSAKSGLKVRKPGELACAA